MKSISYPQFRIVEADTAQELSEELNRALRELNDKHPNVTFAGTRIARIEYTETIRDIPEDLSDEYQIQGVNLYCDDCPYFERMKKADGTEDLRKNFGTCPFSSCGVAHKRAHACETLFKMINSGEVKLCLEK